MKKLSLLLSALVAAAALFVSCSGEATTETVYAYSEPTLKEISIFKNPDTVTYAANTALDLSGLIVSAKYSNGVTGIITDFTTNPENGSLLEETGTKEIVVSYKKLTASFSINVYEKLPSTEAVLTDISILQLPSKTVYEKDQPLDLTGIFVIASYSDNKNSIVTDFTTDPAEGTALTEVGDQTVTVSYGAFSQTFQVKVAEQVLSNDVYLESINVYQRPSKVSYEEGDAFDSTGLIVTGTYSDGLVGLINGYTLDLEEGAVLSDKGTVTVTVKKDSLTASFTIEVVEKVIYGTVSGIAITVAPNADISISQETVTNGIKFSAPEGYASYKWTVNSTAAGTEKEYVLNTTGLINGVYEIFLLVKDDKNNYKSAQIFVQVNN